MRIIVFVVVSTTKNNYACKSTRVLVILSFSFAYAEEEL